MRTQPSIRTNGAAPQRVRALRATSAFTLTEVLAALLVITVGALPLVAVTAIGLQSHVESSRDARGAATASTMRNTIEAVEQALLDTQRNNLSIDALFLGPLNNQIDDPDDLYLYDRENAGSTTLGFVPQELFAPITDTNNPTSYGNFSALAVTDRDYDFRMATRVSKWRFVRADTGSGADNDPATIDFAVPAEFEYFLYLFDGGFNVPANLEDDDDYLDRLDEYNLSGDGAKLRRNIGTGRGTLLDDNDEPIEGIDLEPGSKMLITIAADPNIPDYNRSPLGYASDAIGRKLATGSGDAREFEIAATLQKRGLTPPVYIVECFGNGVVGPLPDDPFFLPPGEDVRVYLLPVPANVRTIIRGTVGF